VLYRFNAEGLDLALRKPKETNQVQRFKTLALRRLHLLDIVSLYGPKGPYQTVIPAKCDKPTWNTLLKTCTISPDDLLRISTSVHSTIGAQRALALRTQCFGTN
jgi:hypothetical protein